MKAYLFCEIDQIKTFPLHMIWSDVFVTVHITITLYIFFLWDNSHVSWQVCSFPWHVASYHKSHIPKYIALLVSHNNAIVYCNLIIVFGLYSIVIYLCIWINCLFVCFLSLYCTFPVWQDYLFYFGTNSLNLIHYFTCSSSLVNQLPVLEEGQEARAWDSPRASARPPLGLRNCLKNIGKTGKNT